MNFWNNVLAVLETRGMSVRALALDIGLTPGALSKYSRGSVPGLDVAGKIAQRLGLSLDSLMWGSEGSTSAAPCPSPSEHALLRELVSDLGMGDLVTLASLGSQSVAWDITQLLISHNPVPVTRADLLSALSAVDESTVDVNLLGLRKRRIVREDVGPDGGINYSLKRPVAEFSARELGDMSIHVKRAVRVIFEHVLPGLEQRHESCHLTTVTATVPLEVARKMSRELHQTIIKRSAEYSAEEGSVNVHVVFGVAAEEAP